MLLINRQDFGFEKSMYLIINVIKIKHELNSVILINYNNSKRLNDLKKEAIKLVN